MGEEGREGKVSSTISSLSLSFQQKQTTYEDVELVLLRGGEDSYGEVLPCCSRVEPESEGVFFVSDGGRHGRKGERRGEKRTGGKEFRGVQKLSFLVRLDGLEVEES